jgi:hypothetical protein
MSMLSCRRSLATAANVLVEAGDPEVVASFVTKFNPWNDVHVVPVVDLGEAVPIAQSTLRGRRVPRRLISLARKAGALPASRANRRREQAFTIISHQIRRLTLRQS